jgi:hypothetical protein
MKFSRKSSDIQKDMTTVLQIAKNLLSLPDHTVYRRRTGEPVKVKVVPLRRVPMAACRKWGDYSDNLVIERRKTDRRTMHFRSGLMEDKVLHGFITATLGPFVWVDNLRVAPWNYAAHPGVDPLTYDGWRQTEAHEAMAVRGTGWSMLAVFCSHLYAFQDPGFFPIKFNIARNTGALRFYRDIVGATCRKGLGVLPKEAVEKFLRRAWMGASRGVPGWQIRVS